MDGIKGRLTDSLRFRLSAGLATAILCVALIAGMFAFIEAFKEAHELQDDMLRQMAALFDEQHLPVQHLANEGRLADSDEEAEVVVEVLPSGLSSGQDSRLPATLADGLQTAMVKGESFRILVKPLGSNLRLAVAQETALRDEIARDSALRTVLPFLILVPVLLLVVAALVRRMFKPVSHLSTEIDGRSELELHPIAAAPLPVEIRPFVVALNRLLGRVAQSMEEQRRFVADAAHELRSPLTALSLQAERLAEAEMSEDARKRLATLRQGIERGRNLLEQLLALARAQAAPTAPPAPISVQQVYRRVLEDLMPLAEAKGIDIGVVEAEDMHIQATEVDLTTIVKNLVDNAIRYTPPGGRIDLWVRQAPDGIALTVEDNGPGLAEAERLRVLDAFYRVLGTEETGSGLGLSIVKTLVERMGGRIALTNAERSPTGLAVHIHFPATGQDAL